MSRTIACAVDGSPIAAKAFDYCLEYVRKENDNIIIIYVPEYPISFPAGVAANFEQVCNDMKKKEGEVNALTASYTQKLRERGIPGKAVKGAGKPGEAIMEVCRQEGVNHIVMGTRGLSKLQRAFLGSVSNYVLNHADIPVTIVPGGH